MCCWWCGCFLSLFVFWNLLLTRLRDGLTGGSVWYDCWFTLSGEIWHERHSDQPFLYVGEHSGLGRAPTEDVMDGGLRLCGCRLGVSIPKTGKQGGNETRDRASEVMGTGWWNPLIAAGVNAYSVGYNSKQPRNNSSSPI